MKISSYIVIEAIEEYCIALATPCFDAVRELSTGRSGYWHPEIRLNDSVSSLYSSPSTDTF